MLHINHLEKVEMLAVRNAWLAFKEQLTGMTVQLMSANATLLLLIDPISLMPQNENLEL